MFKIIFKRDDSINNIKNEVKEIKKELKKNLTSTREEFEDHLEAINENTNEIQSNYEFLCDLDSKIEKLNERIDKIQFLLEGKKDNSYEIMPLTKREQEIFLVLYTSDNFLSYSDIAKRTTLTFSLVQAYISNIIAKGIPIMKKYIDNKAFLYLDPAFKARQAKENLVKIDDSIVKIIF